MVYATRTPPFAMNPYPVRFLAGLRFAIPLLSLMVVAGCVSGAADPADQRSSRTPFPQAEKKHPSFELQERSERDAQHKPSASDT